MGFDLVFDSLADLTFRVNKLVSVISKIYHINYSFIPVTTAILM